jgi:transglutaminase-like putative cysteine protease
VDFFLEGEPGAMAVTQTTVHKLNGQPFYTWEQGEDDTWHTVPVDRADNRLLGVIQGEDAFEFIYRVTLPELPQAARMWLPIPASDAFQTVELLSLDAPGRRRMLTDRAYSNQVLFLDLDPAAAGARVELRFAVQRKEKSAYGATESNLSPFLNPERLVPDDARFREIAEEVLKGKEGEMVRARALYDHVIERMSYMKYGKGWGQGDATYACDARSGNCSDFHAYFIALARSAGIPARFAIGAAIPSERHEGGIDGYHCWAEFHADGRWWPVDISEGDKYSALATYYFGRHPANRIELSRGRDLAVEPAPVSGPINFLAYPVLEIAGRAVKPAVEFAFVRP